MPRVRARWRSSVGPDPEGSAVVAARIAAARALRGDAWRRPTRR